MKKSTKGNQYNFGMKAHIGKNAESGPVHAVRSKPGQVNNVVAANSLPHGQETKAWGGAGYQGASKQTAASPGMRWNIAMRPGTRRRLDLTKPFDHLTDELEAMSTCIRGKVENPFRVTMRWFGPLKVSCRWLAKNAAQLNMLFALANLWMARRQLAGARA